MCIPNKSDIKIGESKNLIFLSPSGYAAYVYLYLILLYAVYLCFTNSLCLSLSGNDLSGGRLQQLALASVALDSLPRRLGKGVGLDGNVLGGEIVSSDDYLVQGEFGFGDGSGFE